MNKLVIRIFLGVVLAAMMLIGSAASVAVADGVSADPNDPNTVQAAE